MFPICLTTQSPCLHQELARLSLPPTQKAEREVTIVGSWEWPPGRAGVGRAGGGGLGPLLDTSSWKKAEDTGHLALSGKGSQAL